MTTQVIVNGNNYNVVYSEWTTWDNKPASGYSCQVDKTTQLASTTLEGLKNKIKNHKPFSNKGAASYYGVGAYNGD